MQRLRRAPDAVIAAMLAVAGGAVAVVFLDHIGKTFFYQTQMSAAVMAACGRKFAEPLLPPRSLVDFLFMQTVSFNCADLHSVAQTRTIGTMTQFHLYLVETVVVLWRWFGVSYQSLVPLLAILHGAYAAGCYVLSRLFLNRITSGAISLILLISPVTVSMLYFLRDYAKAPFFIWIVVFLLLAIRETRTSRLIVLGLGTGIAVGVGSGFRSDLVVVMLPLSIAILAFGLPKRVTLVARAGTVGAFAITTALLLMPLRPDAPAAGGGFLLMEGLTIPFSQYLGLRPAPYDLGWAYSDELAFASISSDLRRPDPARYDAHESKPYQGPTQSFNGSTRYVAGWLPFFAADMATRAVKSAALLAGYYGAFAIERRALDPFPAPFASLRASPVLSDASISVFEILARRRLPTAIGLIGLSALLLSVFARSRREAAALAVMFGVLVSYPSLQFSSRHFFHLEFIVWLGVGSLLALPWTWRNLRPHAIALTARAGIIILMFAAGYAILILLQDVALKTQIRRMLSGPKSLIATSESAVSPTRTLISVAIPPQSVELVNGPPDSLSLPRVRTVPAYSVRSASQRLLVEIGGPNCPVRPLRLTLSYLTRPGIWQPLERTIEVPSSSDGRTLLITSAFYRPTQYFQGFEVDASQRPCLRSIHRLSADTSLPAVFTAVLSNRWRKKPFHLRF